VSVLAHSSYRIHDHPQQQPPWVSESLPSFSLTGLQELAALDVANSSVYVLLTKDKVMSNALAISLAPIYLNISGLDGCSPVSSFLLEDCVPGDSYLRIFATNVYPPISITVADQLCTGLQVLPGFVQCLLAAPEGFLPEVPYNVIVTQGSNQYIVPSAVAFTSRPVILDITSSVCAPDYLSQQSPPQLNCMAGDTVVIIGSFVASPVSLAVLLTANQVTVACSSPVLLSVWALSCVLPVELYAGRCSPRRQRCGAGGVQRQQRVQPRQRRPLPHREQPRSDGAERLPAAGPAGQGSGDSLCSTPTGMRWGRSANVSSSSVAVVVLVSVCSSIRRVREATRWC
jgi:hypothetical protein